MESEDKFSLLYQKLKWKFDAVLESSDDGIWILDGATNVININKAAERLNKIQAIDIVGKSAFDLMDNNLFERSVALEVLETGKQVSMVEKTKRTDKILLYTATPVFDEMGNIELIVVNERDISRLTSLQKQLEQSEMAREKYRDKLVENNFSDFQKQGIIGHSKAMQQILNAALRLSHIGVSDILILGESGTGKGLLSNFIHQNSSRAKKPFVQVNCAALPETLLEAELFGYEKGAFTGAREQGKIGLFEVAHQGTLFLDEIGDMSLQLQAKLLTYLDNQQITRIGATKPRKIDCAVIAATNRNLDDLIQQKQFREDLYHRLNTFMLKIPPLRQRPEDIFELAHYYLKKYNKKYHQKRTITQKGLSALQNFSFSGNVRQLKNIFKQVVVMNETNLLDDNIMQACQEIGSRDDFTADLIDSRPGLIETVETIEKELLLKTMKTCKTVRKMAEALKVSHVTVLRKMKKYQLSR